MLPEEAPGGSLPAGELARVAVVGMSVRPTCGVRDHATLLAAELGREGVSCSLHWLSRERVSAWGARSEARTWAAELAGQLERERPDAVLLHYSAFAYSYRGIPILLGGVLSATGRSGAPLLGVLHELAYPWGHEGVRGALWGIAQRAWMIPLMRGAAGVVVTADFQERWLRSRRWLPRRPVLVAPVFSNLPPPSEVARRGGEERLVGLFGYAYEGAAVSLVLDAARTLTDRGVKLRLEMLGAPGRSSAAGQAWLEAAEARGVGELLRFSGVLGAQELSDALAGCDVLVVADGSGPSSRKGTLAGSLASGTAVVTIDGPRRWSQLVDARAVEVVRSTPDALAGVLGALLADESRREALGARGQAFAGRQMGIARTAEAVVTLLRQAGVRSLG